MMKFGTRWDFKVAWCDLKQSFGASFSTIRILRTIKAMFLYMVVLLIAFIVVFCMVDFTVAFTDVLNQRLFVIV